jgi:hypothetical protein
MNIVIAIGHIIELRNSNSFPNNNILVTADLLNKSGISHFFVPTLTSQRKPSAAAHFDKYRTLAAIAFRRETIKLSYRADFGAVYFNLRWCEHWRLNRSIRGKFKEPAAAFGGNAKFAIR